MTCAHDWIYPDGLAMIMSMNLDLSHMPHLRSRWMVMGKNCGALCKHKGELCLVEEEEQMLTPHDN